MNRKQIATELLDGVPEESREDHETIALAIIEGVPFEKILAMRETNAWPATYSWLKTKFGI